MFGRQKDPGRRGRRKGGGSGKGSPPKECVCPNCGNSVPHVRGMPCYQQKCEKCGSLMTGRL